MPTTSVSYQDLNPTSFLERAAMVYPDKPAVVYNGRAVSYAEFHERSRRLASALQSAGVGKGDRVAFLCPNIPPMLEGYFGPLGIGAILVALNTRLSPGEISYILNHSGAKLLVFDSEFSPTVKSIIDETSGVETYVQVLDTHSKDPNIPGPDYESFINGSNPIPRLNGPDTELDTIAINYTSGTTGFPKGVEYTSRGAYLNAIGEVLEIGLNWESRYLWTLPMFHASGWCFPWAVTAVGGTHVCLRRVDPEEIYLLIREEGISHMCAAPTVLTAMYSSPAADGRDLSGLNIMTAGAPPAPQVIKTIEHMGAHIHHVYGLTETYGPHTVCAPQTSWNSLSPDDQAQVKARQGVPYIVNGTDLRVVDEYMNDVAQDGETMGEVVMRGNNVMAGYYTDEDATEVAFKGGWFHSGDLAVWHTDSYIELRDRAKDVIISGGENISTQEVEKVIMDHPAVLEVSVVGVPDDHWGEVPKAFVVVREGQEATAESIISFTQERIARFKAPKYVEFGDLPKTSTGKIQKYILREKEWEGHSSRIQGSQV
ncbi:MAG: acyl--CoA ligase family protein [Dehalococcoidia bacterium]|nr:acyl--CoA ligase family protein [Dehalococcoidia bacterium]